MALIESTTVRETADFRRILSSAACDSPMRATMDEHQATVYRRITPDGFVDTNHGWCWSVSNTRTMQMVLHGNAAGCAVALGEASLALGTATGRNVVAFSVTGERGA